MRILLVEDDESIVDVLATILADQNYVVDVAMDGEAGWELVESFPYDLVLLDIMLPKLDGISFCRRLRERNNSVLVMMLTVRDNTTDKLLGLNSGADDYVVKPFDIQELVARIRALLRRGNTATSSALVCGDLRLDPDIRTVTYAGQPLQFSRKEYLLLELFLRNPQRVFSRSAIVEHLWSFDEEAPIEDTIKSHIKNIRQELRTVNADDLIETLYGQGYRINPAYLTKSSSSESSTDTQQRQLDATVAQIWQRKKGASLERLTLLEQAVRALKTQTLNADLIQNAIQNAHKLAGSLGTFGLDEGSRLARQIEGMFQSQLDASGQVLPRQQKKVTLQLEEWISILRQEIEGKPRPLSRQPASLVERADASSVISSTNKLQSVILVIHEDPDLMDSLVLEAITWNILVITAPDLATAQAQLRQQTPDLILLNPALLNQPGGSSTLPAELVSSVPIVVFAAQEQLTDRLAAVHLGAKLFLSTTMPPSQVLHAVAKLLHELNWGVAKILVVDSDPQTAKTLRSFIAPHTIQLTELNDPTQFWETLKTVHPDLLILNAHFPNVQIPQLNGLTLCQSVRQDFQWNWLPILVLMHDPSPTLLQQALAVGVDDYATKPIDPQVLTAQIFNRLQRSRLLRSQAETDALTDLANRQQSTQALNQLLQLAHRSQQAVCLATLDLDHFKQINDRFGHVQGDRVLRQFGQFLKQKFRSEDVVARWGGEEFVIGMYGITREDGVERLAEILEEWRSLVLSSNSTPVYVSFSAGVAQYPTDGVNLQMLYRAADTALYRAKVAGRDRVVSTKWQPLSSTAEVDVILIYPKSEFAQGILRALETRGYHTRWLQNGKDALNQFRAKHSKLKAPVILLSDNLPDQNYLSLIQELGTKRLKYSRVILLITQPNLKGQVRMNQIFDYLLIPCNLSVIMQRLRQALEKEPLANA